MKFLLVAVILVLNLFNFNVLRVLHITIVVDSFNRSSFGLQFLNNSLYFRILNYETRNKC